ncbi:LrgB family protein [Paraferrimonas sp. SM1919]|uniref:LrgB family protein n=1 Tax=Paraferrimonas sp. SM1919 TaxID=2662263 RepID=UPI0013D3B51C|nr:LrgB family protein [Paraferrimonas sp. SM1919]
MEITLISALSLSLTLGLFKLCQHWQRRFKWLNPVIFTSLLIMIAILLFNVINLEDYQQGTRVAYLLLEWVVILFAVPLYNVIQQGKRHFLKLAVICLMLTGLSTVIGTIIYYLLGLSEALQQSLAGKSITTPLALVVTAELDGVLALSAFSVTIAGLTGSLSWPWLVNLLKIENNKVIGVAVGSSSHAMGTASLLRASDTALSYSASALVLCGAFSVLIIPWLTPKLLLLLY